MSAPVTVVATWDVAEDDVPWLLERLGELRRATLAEPGCRRYDVFRSAETPTRFVLIETYADAAAVDAHVASPHYQRLVAGEIRPRLVRRHVERLGQLAP